MVSGKLTMQVKRVRELEGSNNSLENQLKKMREEEESRENDALKERLNEQEMKNAQLRTEVALKEREVSCITEELQIMRAEAEKQSLETDRYATENRKLQMMIGEGSKNLEALQMQKE